MTDQALLKELSAALATLSPGQRDQLAKMLHDPARRRAFQQLIDSTLKLSNEGGAPRNVLWKSSGDADSVNAMRSDYDEDSIRQSFASVFSDKDTFPTTSNVIDAVQHFFDAKIDRRRFAKAGRRATIAEAWRQVTAMPVEERSDKLRRFFRRFEHLLDPHRSYRELFRVLSRSE